MFQVVVFGKEHLHNIKSNSTNETNTKVTKQTNVKEKNRERKVVDRISVASNNKLQIEEREKYENKAEKSAWLLEDAWDHVTAPRDSNL